MTLLRFLDAAIQRLCAWAVVVAGGFVAILVILGVADVFATHLIFGPVPAALELSEAAMVFVVFGGMAYAQNRRSHVAIDVFSARFKGRARTVTSAFALAAAVLILGLMAWRAGVSAWESFAISERSAGLWPFLIFPLKTGMWLGCLIAALEALRQLVRLCVGLPESEAANEDHDMATP